MIEIIFSEMKKVARTLLVLDGICVVAAVLLERADRTLWIGIGYGNLFTLLYFILLGSVVKNALERPPDQAKRYLKWNYAARYLLLGAILAVAFVSPWINPWCVCLSFLAPKITYTAIGFQQMFCDKFGIPYGKSRENENEQEDADGSVH